MKHQKKREKGLILVTVIIFVLIISILAVAILFIMTSEARLTERQIRRIKAGYAVQAGVQHFLNLLRGDPSITTATITDIDGMSVGLERYASPGPPGSGCPSGSDCNCIKATVDY
ncbi:MAG: PilX N-terminal domain-containing pilus assembly protein [Candidatus Omnitrophota bacterium]